jgi:hypothetical protein
MWPSCSGPFVNDGMRQTARYKAKRLTRQTNAMGPKNTDFKVNTVVPMP